ncbi:MAG: DNA-directed RNA polymerase subunit omega [Fusobacteriaceae bacterium]
MEKKITFDDLISRIPNKYELTIVVGKRTRDIIMGVKNPNEIKQTAIQKCFKEIYNGKVVVGDIDQIEILEENNEK